MVHGDLHPVCTVNLFVDAAFIHSPQGNVLIDGSGNPCLTAFGLAAVVGNSELQLTTMTAEYNFNSRWRTPEVIGIEHDPTRLTFKSDVYSCGSVIFFVRIVVSLQLYPKPSHVRSPREIYHGKRRRSRIKFALSCRRDPPLRVPKISLTGIGT